MNPASLTLRYLFVIGGAIVFGTAVLLSGLGVLPHTLALFIKIVFAMILLAALPWLMPSPWRFLKSTPASTTRMIRLFYWTILGLIAGMIVLSLISVLGIHCAPTMADISALVVWSLAGVALVASGGFILRHHANIYRQNASVRRICYECGYDMRQIPSNACPECGYQYEPIPVQPGPDPEPAVN